MKNRKQPRKNLDARIMQIMKLAFRVNRDTKHLVCFAYSGRVKDIEIRIYINGYIPFCRPDFIGYLSADCSVVNAFATCAEIRAKLNNLLQKK